VDLDGTTLMSKGREIRCYDYVNHPYERVRDALRQDALIVFPNAGSNFRNAIAKT
jgi:hypothetical protein